MSNHFYETHYEDYINEKNKNDLHPKLTKMASAMPDIPMSNLIFYGPPGIGKYSSSLMFIRKYSNSNLAYEKKMNIVYNKDNYCYKISDVHFEIDMETLGCNARLLWTEIFAHIEDVVSSRQNKFGIILCKNFHTIHSELLENFYSYMQRNGKMQHLYFYIISESISFIPANITNCCLVMNIARPSITQYNKCLYVKLKPGTIIENMKEVKCDILNKDKYSLIGDSLYDIIMNPNDLKFAKFRDILYDLLIYNYDIGRVIFTLLSNINKQSIIVVGEKKYMNMYIKIYEFLKNYNNNYRPIYHLELLMFNIIGILHGL